MPGYTKLFSTIIASTVWRETKETKIVWITMLALSDQFGNVEASIPGLADLARVTVDECRKAIESLSTPDPDSRTTEHEGRRIKKIEGGWQILNYAKYRIKMNEEDRQLYMRKYMQEYRKQFVNKSKQKLTRLTHADADADADADTKKEGASPLRAFTDAWMKAFQEVHSAPYVFQGVKDSQAALRLLKSLPTETLIAIARRAWVMPDKWLQNQACSLASFASQFNKIQAVVGQSKPAIPAWDDPTPANL